MLRKPVGKRQFTSLGYALHLGGDQVNVLAVRRRGWSLDPLNRLSG